MSFLLGHHDAARREGAKIIGLRWAAFAPIALLVGARLIFPFRPGSPRSLLEVP